MIGCGVGTGRRLLIRCRIDTGSRAISWRTTRVHQSLLLRNICRVLFFSRGFLVLADIGGQFGDQLIDVAGGGARRRQRPCRRRRRTVGGGSGGSDEIGHEGFLVGEMLPAGN
jgi:hypothetical protein